MLKKTRGSFIAAAALAVWMTAPGRASAEDAIRLASLTQSSHSVSTSATSSGAPAYRVMDHLTFNYFGVFHGAPLNHFSSAHQADRNGDLSASQGVNLDGELTATYLFDKRFGLGPSIPFLLVPVLGQGFVLGDVGLRAIDKETVYSNGLTVASIVTLQFPTSTGSQNRDQALGVRLTPYIRYAIPSSRLTIGAWTEEKAYLGVSHGTTFKLFGAPYANYRLTPTLSLNFQYDIDARHNLGDAGLMSLSLFQTDFVPGVIWMITPKVALNPYVQFFTTNELSADRAALGATISATL